MTSYEDQMEQAADGEFTAELKARAAAERDTRRFQALADERAAEQLDSVKATVTQRVAAEVDASGRTVPAAKVWRAAGNAGSGFARLSDLEVPGLTLQQTHLEIYRVDLTAYLERTDELFRIV